MDSSTKIDANEYAFSKNVNLEEADLSEIKKELLKKKILLNSAFNSPHYTTDKLYNYVIELEEHIENATLAKEKLETTYKDSVRICNLLLGASIFIFVIFVIFALFTSNILLGIIALINGLVFGIIIYYKKNLKKNLNIT